jgi:hypothetical protein
MANNGENQEQLPQEPPEFLGEWFWAFAAVMLYRCGGYMAISLEHLKQFDYDKDNVQVSWDAKNKSFVMYFKDEPKVKNQGISVPGKIRKKLFRQMIKNNFG